MSLPHTTDSLLELEAVLKARINAGVDKSYVASLIAKGEDAVLKKIGEEATELVMAAKDGERQKIIYEAADLIFHSMIALTTHGVSIAEVVAELERRRGTSGLEEAALRKLQSRS